MPIKPENKARYPLNLAEISKRIRQDRVKGKINNIALGGLCKTHSNMSIVKAKLVCNSSTPAGEGQKLVTFSAVVSGSEENKSFSKYTPGANLEMYISDQTPASDYFTPGKEYYLNFEEAE
jgi:hypothetical protein